MPALRQFPTTAFARRRAALRGMRLAHPVAGFFLLLWVGQARAEFAVCNQTLDVVNVAIGREDDSGAGGVPRFVTEGWWTVGANQCANVIQEVLSKRYIYVYATDIFGRQILNGSTAMCVDRRRFHIRGIGECWQQGHIEALFFEVDTLEQERWTLFLGGSVP